MAVVLRLARGGQKKRPHYRVVVAEKTSRRDGRFIDVVGSYNPLTNPPTVKLNKEKIQKWLDTGAKPSETVKVILRKDFPGMYEAKESHKKAKVVAARKARKARAGKAPVKKAAPAKKASKAKK